MEPLIPSCYYHIYNRTNGNDNLFNEPKNYIFFLDRYKKYILPIADLYAYCLIPNHFHFLIKIKDDNDIVEEMYESRALEKYRNTDSIYEKQSVLSEYLSKQFANYFSSYTQSFNKMYNRKGSLFMKNFKRKIVVDERYLQELVIYIHNNPVAHGIVNHPKNWFNSSYNSILSGEDTLVVRKDVLYLFDDVDNFRFCHL